MTRKIENTCQETSDQAGRKVLAKFDVTPLIGLRVLVRDAAIMVTDEDGDATIDVPNLRTLMACAAVSRCLMPIRFRGRELRAMRKIMGLTLAGLAARLDAKTAPETLSRWESEAQPIGGYAEKVLRLLICDALHDEARGVSYDGSMIARIRVLDPWITNKEFVVPEMEFQRVKMREHSGDVVDAWDVKSAA